MRRGVRGPIVLLRHLANAGRVLVAQTSYLPTILSYVYRATLKTAVFVFGIVLIGATAKAIFSSYIVVEPISVPRRIEEVGYSGAVVSRAGLMP